MTFVRYFDIFFGCKKRVPPLTNSMIFSKILLVLLFVLLLILVFISRYSFVLSIAIISLLIFTILSFIIPWCALLIFIAYSLSGILYIIPLLHNINSSAVFLYILTFCFFVSAILGRTKILIIDNQTFFIILFFSLISISAYYSGNIQSNAGYSIIKTCIFLLVVYFLIIHQIVSHYTIRWFFRTLMITGVIVAVSGISQNLFYKNNSLLYFRQIRFGILDPNYLAIFLIMLIPLAYSLILLEKKLIWQFAALLSIYCFIIAIFLSLSRSSIVLFVICLFLLLRLNYSNYHHIFSKIWFSILGFFLILAPFVYQNYWLRFSNLLYDKGSGRIYLFDAAYHIIKKHPLTGIGYGNFTKLFYFTQDWGLLSLRVGSHNMYLGIAAELGLIGLMLYLAVFMSAFKTLFKICKSSIVLHRKPALLMANAIIISLVVYMIGGLFFHYYDFYLSYVLLASVVVLKNNILCNNSIIT